MLFFRSSSCWQNPRYKLNCFIVFYPSKHGHRSSLLLHPPIDLERQRYSLDGISNATETSNHWKIHEMHRLLPPQHYLQAI